MEQKLSAWAKDHGMSYGGALTAFHRGDIPRSYQLPSGSIFVSVSPSTPERPGDRAALYSRVSTKKQADDLSRQADRIQAFALGKGLRVVRDEQEIASGMNENRRKLHSLLADDSWDVLIVEHKDRLARFGFGWIVGWVESQGREVVVVNETSGGDDESLMTDLAAVVSSFCGRLYGRRGGKAVADKAMEVVDSG